MSQKRLRSFLFPPFLLFLLFCSCLLLLNDLIQRPKVQQFIVRRISDAAGFTIKIESFDINLLKGFGITAHGLSATFDNRRGSLTASGAGIGLDPMALLKGRILPTTLSLDNPIIAIGPKADTIGKQSGLRKTLMNAFIWDVGFLRSVNITGGLVRVRGWPYRIEELAMHMGVLEDVGMERYFQLRCRVKFQDRYLPLGLRGKIRKGIDGNKLMADISGESGNVPASWVPWPHFVSFSGGKVGAAFHIKGALGEALSTKGNFNGRDLQFDILSKSRHKKYKFKSIHIPFKADFDKGHWKIRLPGVKFYKTILDTRIEIAKVAGKSTRLDLSITSPFMPMQTFKRLFPTSLVPGWIEKELFPSLAEGEVKTQRFHLGGTMDEISHLGRAENVSALSMKVSWRGLKALKRESPLPFEMISGAMEISANHLSISRLKGRFGRSSVKKGTFEVHPLVGGRPIYRVGLDGEFYLEDLITLRRLPWTPPGIKEEMAKLKGSEGPLTASIKLYKKAGVADLHLRKALLKLKGCSIVHEAGLFPFKVDAGEIQLTKPGTVRFRGQGKWGHSALEIDGASELSLVRGYAKVTGTIDLEELTAELTKEKKWVVDLGKRAFCKVNINREKGSWSFNGAFEMEKENGIRVSSSSSGSGNKKNSLSFDATYLPGRALVFRSLRGELGRSVFKASGNMDLSQAGTLNVDLKTPGVFLKDLGIRIGRKDTPPEGFLLGNIQASIPLKDPLSSDIEGELEALHIRLPLKGLAHPIREGRFKATFSGKTTSISSLGFKLGKSTVGIRGNLTGRKPLNGNLMFQSNFLDTADFIKKRTDEPRKASKAIWRYLQQENTELAVSVKVERIHWRKVMIGPFRADGAFQGGDFRLKSSKVKMKHGDLKTSGYIRKKGNRIQLASHIRLYRQPVQEFFAIFSDKPSFIQGRLSTDTVFTTTGRDRASLIEGLDGKGEMLIENGKILKSNVLIKVMDFLSLQKIFRRPPPDLSKKGFYFHAIGCDFVAKKGLLNTEDLVMKSPVFNGVIRGKLDMNRSRIEADLHVQPLVTMDSLVSKIPIVGYILTGKDKTLLVYYFKIRGPMAAPEVIYVPLKHWGNSILGYVTRAFLTPPRVFEKIREMVKPPEK